MQKVIYKATILENIKINYDTREIKGDDKNGVTFIVPFSAVTIEEVDI